MRETWYVLEDGTVVDPREVTRDDKGALVHKRAKVQMRGDTPRSRNVEIDEQKPEPPERARAKDMKPEQPKRGGYTTRQSKTRAGDHDNG